MYVDLVFPVYGESLPTDHAYPLFAGLSTLVPAFHDPAAGVRFCTVSGPRFDRGLLAVTDRSVLRVRLPQDRIADVLPLAGKKLDVAGHAVRFGVPRVTLLEPAARLYARVVTIKTATGSTEVEPFLEAARKQLAALGVEGEVAVPRKATEPRVGEPCRRVVRVKGKAIVGYVLLVSGLSADHAVRLQEHGLGGRTRIGCGFFLPVREGR